MVKFDSTIFREYDIRGIDGESLTEEFALQLGKGFGTYLLERGTENVLLGRDTRFSSEKFAKAISQGLLSCGCDVFDIGLCLTSVIYFARHKFAIDGGIYITASHNPPKYNGFKLCHGVNAITGVEIQKVKKIMESGNFKIGQGKYFEKTSANKEYYQEVLKKIKLERPLKVVVDSGNMTPGLFVPNFLRDLGCEVIELFSQIDPSMKNHIPDPVAPQAYKFLTPKVVEKQADLGILLDGDGDRVGFVDNEGNVRLGDIILGLLVREILPRNPKAKVIVEVKDSEMVVDEVKKFGGKPIFWKTGHALLDQKVYEEKAILCGEMSCHYWITENWFCFDDAIFALANLLKIISKSKKSFKQLVEELPQYFSTPEYRLPCPEKEKFSLVTKVVNYFKPKCSKIVDVDGIRGYLEDGWFLFRASNTQPMVSLRCEAKTQEGLEKIKSTVKNYLDNFKEINLDWGRPYNIA